MYIVGVYYSFDQSMPMHLWDTEEKAAEFIKKDSEQEVKTANEEGSAKVISYQHSDDYSWAKIVYEDGWFMEWTIGTIHDKRTGSLTNLCRQMRTIIFYSHEEVFTERSNKEIHRIVLTDHLTDKQKAIINSCMDVENGFIPRQVGLPEVMIHTFSHGWWKIESYDESMDSTGTAICSSDELVEMFQKAKDKWVDWTKDPMEKAKFLINQYCLREFNSEADFSDLENIAVGCTDDPSVECFVDLKGFKFKRYANGYLRFKEQYASLEEMIYKLLQDLDFETIVAFDDEI